MTGSGSERRRGGDRRASAPSGPLPPGGDRRRGPRRRPLPRPWWADAPAIVVALALGVATAAIAQPGAARPRSGLTPGAWAREAQASPAATEATAALEAARSLRDEAEALTPATVALDESELGRWLERAAAIEALLADASTPAAVRGELEAALAALVRLGVVREIARP